MCRISRESRLARILRDPRAWWEAEDQHGNRTRAHDGRRGLRVYPGEATFLRGTDPILSGPHQSARSGGEGVAVE